MLDVPVISIDPALADEHFGVVGQFFRLAMTGSIDWARAETGWESVGPTLVDDILCGAYTRRWTNEGSATADRRGAGEVIR